MPFEEQVVVCMPSQRTFDGTAIVEVKSVEAGLIDFVKKMYGEILEAIKKTGELPPETEEKLKKRLRV